LENYIKYCVFNEFDPSRVKLPKNVSETELHKNEAQFSILDSNLTIDRQNNVDEFRLKFFTSFAQNVINFYEFKGLNIKGIISLGDEILDDEYTRLCFARKRNSPHICIPDPHAFNAVKICENIPQIDLPFESKINKACFVGSDTGLKFEDESTQRSRFCHLYKNNEKIYAKITNFVQGDFDSEISGPYCPVSEQLKYKYILNINGNTTSWERLLWAMNSNSHCIFIKQPLHQNDLSWYYHIFDIEKCFIETDEYGIENLLGCADELNFQFNAVKENQKKIGKMLVNPAFHANYFASLILNYNHAYNESLKLG